MRERARRVACRNQSSANKGSMGRSCFCLLPSSSYDHSFCIVFIIHWLNSIFFEGIQDLINIFAFLRRIICWFFNTFCYDWLQSKRHTYLRRQASFHILL
ncbi:unnamed protein product [Moneuplotes crassus]|uniref:Uncharacterized protein n=1 Tax=Euplotes crassus TaxID=5936 RepID=A0AAD1Y6L1_EUPCR|nr:unnamed protein product [Moneuplotes crassus]